MLVLNELIKNQELCKLLYYKDSDPLSQSDISNSKDLINKNILAFPFIDEVVKDTSSFLMVTFDNFTYSKGGEYQNGDIMFHVLCHKDLWQIKGGLRPYAILDEIQNTFDNKKIGIGKVKLSSLRQSYVNDAYKGYIARFNYIDFVR
jgi:hypothetical protein